MVIFDGGNRATTKKKTKGQGSGCAVEKKKVEYATEYLCDFSFAKRPCPHWLSSNCSDFNIERNEKTNF